MIYDFLFLLPLKAPGFQNSHKMSSANQGSDTASKTNQPEEHEEQRDSGPVPEEVQRLHRGNRELNSLTIETVQQGTMLIILKLWNHLRIVAVSRSLVLH